MPSPKGATDDDNFIGFDKYRKYGAYHWRQLAEDDDYREKAEFIGCLLLPADHCLDLGCGDGAYMYALHERCASITGVDADDDAVRISKAQLKRKAVKNCSAFQLPFTDVTLQSLDVTQPFDLVYSMDVIEHLPRPEQLLELAVDVTKRGGLVVIGTPLHISDALVSPYHVREFRQPEISELVGDYLTISKEVLLASKRPDGTVYDGSFYVAVGVVK